MPEWFRSHYVPRQWACIFLSPWYLACSSIAKTPAKFPRDHILYFTTSRLRHVVQCDRGMLFLQRYFIELGMSNENRSVSSSLQILFIRYPNFVLTIFHCFTYLTSPNMICCHIYGTHKLELMECQELFGAVILCWLYADSANLPKQYTRGMK